jgi:hypothetical protein
METIKKADAKGRLNFGEEFAGRRFRIKRSEGGILIEPIMVVTDEDFLNSPKVRAMLDEADEDLRKGRTKRVSFAEHANDD